MSYKIYGPRGFKSYFHKKTKKQSIKSGLGIDVVTSGIIAVDQKTKAYGVFDNNLKFVKSSRQMKNKDSQFVPKLLGDIPFIDSDVIYFGNVYPQFGHFLLEHMNRAWGLLDDRYKHAKIVLINNRNIAVPEYIYNLIELLGVNRSDIIVLNQTTRFKNVIIPHQGFNIPVYSSREFASAFDKMSDDICMANLNHPLFCHGLNAEYCAENKSEKTAEQMDGLVSSSLPDKIYVSRTAMGNKRTLGEEKIQKIFENNGFQIVCPELLPIAAQAALMKNCRVLAGCAGTALHLALFMPDGGQVIQIKRNRQNKCNAPIQYLINETKNIDSVFIAGSIESVPADHATSAPQIIAVNKYMCQFFKDYGFQCSDQDLSPDTDAWQEYKNLMNIYNSEKGSVTLNKIKQFVIKVSSCVVPGRERRGRFRRWLKDKIKAK